MHPTWAAARAWREITGADHNDLDADPVYWQAIAAFLAERARSRPAPRLPS